MSFIISIEYLYMNLKKIWTITDWKTSVTIWDLQYFSILQICIEFSSETVLRFAALLIWLICKDKLKCNSNADQAFETLKKMFTTESILMHT